MIGHARDELPNECCGIIVADKDGAATKVYRTRNAEASPFRYSIHPQDLFKIEMEKEDNDWEIMVIYHSHVASEAYPSPTDVRLSQWGVSDPPTDLYPGARYVLVSLKDRDKPVIRAYRITQGAVSEEDLIGYQ
jgi:proteasome lid subunit RPN8/RPN11